MNHDEECDKNVRIGGQVGPAINAFFTLLAVLVLLLISRQTSKLERWLRRKVT